MMVLGDIFIVYGCMDFNADNYDELANVDIPDGDDGAWYTLCNWLY